MQMQWSQQGRSETIKKFNIVDYILFDVGNGDLSSDLDQQLVILLTMAKRPVQNNFNFIKFVNFVHILHPMRH